MLERTGQVTYFRLEVVDRDGFGGARCEVVGFSTLGWVVGGASRR